MQDRFPDCPVEQSHTYVPLLTILKLSINWLGPEKQSVLSHQGKERGLGKLDSCVEKVS